MNLKNMEFIKLLPKFMQDDNAVIGLSLATDKLIKDLHNKSNLLSTWNSIDKLSENELDLLADELNITWYLKSEPISVKRDLIKNSDKVYQKLGTKWAVENVIKSYFGDGYIQEWFEYDGEPGYFKIFSSNPSITNEKFMQFLEILSKVKRGSSHLEGIFITLTGQMKLHTGIAYREVAFDTVCLGKKI